MTWDEFRKQVKSVAGRTADKINQSADNAALQLKRSSAERKLSAAYEALGKVAYKHFTEENDNDIQKVTGAVEAIDNIQKEIKTLKAQIEALKKQSEEKAKEEVNQKAAETESNEKSANANTEVQE